jgi:hypothetical protein
VSGCDEWQADTEMMAQWSDGFQAHVTGTLNRPIHRCHNARRGRDEPPIEGCHPDGKPRDRRELWCRIILDSERELKSSVEAGRRDRGTSPPEARRRGIFPNVLFEQQRTDQADNGRLECSARPSSSTDQVRPGCAG